MAKAATTASTAYDEILQAQIVKRQQQMVQLSLNLQAEKARAVRYANPPDVTGQPKI